MSLPFRLQCPFIDFLSCIDQWFDVNRSCPEHPSDWTSRLWNLNPFWKPSSKNFYVVDCGISFFGFLFFGGWLWFPCLNVHGEEEKKSELELHWNAPPLSAITKCESVNVCELTHGWFLMGNIFFRGSTLNVDQPSFCSPRSYNSYFNFFDS